MFVFRNVVEVLVQRDDLILDQRDKEGFTALFHACNHGTNRHVFTHQRFILLIHNRIL